MNRYTQFLTGKQQKVLETLKSYIKDNEESPSVRELQRILKIKSTRSITQYLDILERKGYIYRSGEHRGIRLTEVAEENSDFRNVPILGYANCGMPLANAEEERLGEIQVDKKLIGSRQEVFGIIAKGDSMDQKNIGGNYIEDTDYLIVDKGAEFNNGDAVLAIIDNAATIKTFQRQADLVVLHPESANPIHKPIYLSRENDGMIAGKVVGVFKNPRYLQKD